MLLTLSACRSPPSARQAQFRFAAMMQIYKLFQELRRHVVFSTENPFNPR
jgi:hypothetical protein